VRGARGEAIALGELPAPTGTLEQFASGEGISARYAAAASRAPGPVGNRVPGSDRGPVGDRVAGSARAVLAAADAGDPLAAEVVRTAAEALAAALGWLTCLLDPAAVVLGGGLGHAGGLWGQALSDYAEQAVATRPSPPPVLRGALGPDAGLIGAGLIALAD
jgi:glucokinase